MENSPLISIIVPIYKIPNYIDRCVNSICNQTYQNLEIILVDDGSPDECPIKCDGWKEKDNRITVVHKSNGGLSDARNAGLQIARGEFISFIDGDDWIEEDFISILIKNIINYDADISEVQYRQCMEGEVYDSTIPSSEYIVINRDDAMRKLIENDISQVVWNKLYKKELIKDVLFDIGKYHEDEFWSYQVIDKVSRYVRSKYVGYDYFQRKDSIMGIGYSLKRLDAIEAKVRRQKYLDSFENSLAEIARKNLLFACFYHGQCALRELKGDDCKKAFEFLKNVYCNNRISASELKQMRVSQRLWIRLGYLSFGITCKLRNRLKIGL